MFALLFCSLLALSDAKPKWSFGEELEETVMRRLEMQLTQATGGSEPAPAGTPEPDCIVGGFDTDQPEKVYVGGPCNKMTVTEKADGTIDATPQDGFRWVEMEVQGAGILSADGDEVEVISIPGTSFQHATEASEYAKVGTAGAFRIAETKADVMSGQTSYLVKQTGTFSKNLFAFAKDKDSGEVTNVELCVTKCCDPNGAACECPATFKCDGTDGTVAIQAATYKFSVWLASMNGEGFTAGAEGDGWEKIVETYGTGSPKALKGSFYVDQVIDFTNMNTDSVTLTLLDDTLIKYADMSPFDQGSSGMYKIKAISLEADSFSSSYSFPLLYNKGSWSNGGSTLKTDMTDTVTLFCIRASNKALVKMGMATDDNVGTKKIVMIRYQFDISGISAGADNGNWMAYDPTIKTGVDASVAAAKTGKGKTSSRSHDLVPSLVLLASAIVVSLLKD
jgi:hypothetical protein